MDHDLRYALDATKEITVAKMSNSETRANKLGGEDVAGFYEAVFKKILKLTQSAEN